LLGAPSHVIGSSGYKNMKLSTLLKVLVVVSGTMLALSMVRSPTTTFSSSPL
jgi:hypothetical protein